MGRKNKGYISFEVAVIAALVTLFGGLAVWKFIITGNTQAQQEEKTYNKVSERVASTNDNYVRPSDPGPEGGIGGSLDDTSEPEFTMVSGNTIYYKIGSRERLEFNSNDDFDNFLMVTIDGTRLKNQTDFIASKAGDGTTLVTLRESYISKMKEGEFDVEVVSDEGRAEARLITTYINSFNKDSIYTGYVTPDGTINTVMDTFTFTDMVPVKPGDYFYGWRYESTAIQTSARFITAYDSDGNVLANEGVENASCYVVPDGVAYLVFTVRKSDSESMMMLRGTDNAPKRFVPYNDTGSGKVVIDNLINIFDRNDVDLGYVTREGAISQDVTTLCHTKRILVNEGDTLALWHFHGGATRLVFRFITAYDAKGNVLKDKIPEEGTHEYTVPAGVASLVFTVNTGSADEVMILRNATIAPPCYIPYNGNNKTLDIPTGDDLINIFNPNAVKSGYMGPNGSTSGASSLVYSEKMEVKPGDILYIWNGSSAYKPRFITAFDADGNAVTAAGTSSPLATYTVPDGIAHVVITTYVSVLERFMVFKNQSGTPPQYIPYVENKPTEPEAPKVINYFNPNAVGSGYMAPTGGVSGSSSLVYSEKIYVSEGEVLSFWNGTSEYKPRFITAFNSTGDALGSLGTNSPESTYTVPSGVDSVVITIYTSVLNKFMVLKDIEEKPTEYIAYDASLIPERPEIQEPEENDDFSGREYLYTSGNMSSNTKLSLGKADVITDKHLVFKADVSSFSGVRIGHGYTEYTANYVEIDQTYVRQYFYTSNSATMLKEEKHGLTIEKDIRVQIDVNKRRVATVKIKSNGKEYLFNTGTNWYGSNGEIYAQSLGSTLNNAELAWTTDGYTKDIQFYGDSYLSQSSDRWLYYAFNAGKGNALFDGYGGRTSGGAYNSLLVNLQHSSPKIIVWLLGMNDGSDPNINTPSTAWTTTRDKLIALSQEKGFELVFATIPTVPDINHEAKNKWIRESGYRYIDVASGVGADGTGAWTEGYLSSDKVHPSASGAEAIYRQVALDFPDFK